jgi:hypothetical protein
MTHLFEEDLLWYKNLFDKSDILDNYVGKTHITNKDPYYTLAVKNPKLFVKKLVDASGIDKIRSVKDYEFVFSYEDILRIMNFITPEKVARLVNIRKASHLLKLAACPFFIIHLSSQWAESFKNAKKTRSASDIRVLLSSISILLIEGFDLVLHSSFLWDIPSHISGLLNKYTYILNNNLIPKGITDERFKNPKYNDLLHYFEMLQKENTQKIIIENPFTQRKFTNRQITIS